MEGFASWHGRMRPIWSTPI